MPATLRLQGPRKCRKTQGFLRATRLLTPIGEPVYK
jgi:hypothetical protein